MTKKSTSSKNLDTLREAVAGFEKKHPGILDSLRQRLLNTPETIPVTKTEWADTHPLGLICGSDKYYAELVNRIQRAINAMPGSESTPKDFVKQCAMSAAAYIEDLVSGTRVWDAMRSLSARRYGKPLPIFDIDPDDYYTDDVNLPDVKMIVWQALARTGRDVPSHFISPFSSGVDNIAEIILPILADAMEEAPEAGRLGDFVSRELSKDNIFGLRTLAFWISVSNKLTATPGMSDIFNVQSASNPGSKASINRSSDYDECCRVSWLDDVSFLGIPTSTILAEIARLHGYTEVADKLDGLETTTFQTFKIVKQDRRTTTLENGAGVTYVVDKNSVGQASGYISAGDARYSIMRLMKYGDYWHQNGICVTTIEMNDDIPMDYSDDGLKRREMRRIIDSHNGRRIFYFKTLDEVKELLGRENYSAEIAYDGPIENYLCCVSDDGNFIVAVNFCSIIRDKKNPFFKSRPSDKEEAGDMSLKILTDGNIADDIAKYLQDNDMLPFIDVNMSQGKRFMKKAMKENLRFFIDFYRVPMAEDNIPDEDDDDEDDNEYDD